MHIEDQVMPKRCGHLKGKKLISNYEMCQKIRTACLSRNDENFLIIARTDARSVEGFEAAVNRAKAYVKAGADAIFPEALKSKEEFEEFAKRVNVPLLANMTEFGISPLLTTEELIHGIQNDHFSCYCITCYYEKYRFVIPVKTNGTQLPFLEKMQTRQELYDLIDDTYATLDQKVANYKINKNESK